MANLLAELGEFILEKREDAVRKTSLQRGELNVDVIPEHIVSLVSFLHDHPRCAFTTLIDICGVDYPNRSRRFEIIYHLLSMPQNLRIRLRVQIREEDTIPSISKIFPCADWYEREAFDMFGIMFEDHPDLRRLLTDYGFQGHPLRKDFPLTGHVELRYDEAQKRVRYGPVQLQQELRQFDFVNPWAGAKYARADIKSDR